MSPALLALALLGVVSWILLLAREDLPASRLRLAIEALAVETVIATLIAVGLASFGAFRPALALALTAALPLGGLAVLDRRGARPRLTGPLVCPADWLLLLVLTVAAPIALPRMEQLRMENDAGVYANRAIHHLKTGGLRGSIPVRDRLEGDLLATFDRDNMGAPRSYLPGTYVLASDPGRFHFQFFPGWPLVMALWAGVFGIAHTLDSLVLLYVLSVCLFGLLGERLAEGAVARALTLALFASSPLLLFFARYSTSEILLLFLVLFVLYFLGKGSQGSTVLAGAGVLLFVVSHSSTFLYAPLLLLPLLEAHRSADRRLARFSFLAFGALLAGLPLGYFFSPPYVRDIFKACFGFLPVSDPATAGLALVAVYYAAGCALSLSLLLGAAGPSPRVARWVDRAERQLPVAVSLGLALMAAWTAWRGYQLGWTDRFLLEDGGGAWSYRSEYAGQGWSSLAHLDIVSMVMACSVVGLPTVLGLAVFRGREVGASPRRAFLLGAVLWTLAVYTFFRLDTPFNYYASRYFLPVLVPATLLLFGALLGHFQPRSGTVAALALVGLSFNLYFDWGLYRYPSENEKLRFVEEVAGRVGDNRVLFVRADERTHRLLAVLLQSLHGISVVRVAHLRGQPETTLIARYASDLGLPDAAVLSTFMPAGGRPFAVLPTLERGFTERGVVYPTQYAERVRRCYLYDLVFPRDAGRGGTDSAPSGTRDRDQVE